MENKATRTVVSLLTAFVGWLISIPKVNAVDLGSEFKINSEDTVAETFPDLGTLISTILPNVYIISGLVLLFLVFFGGFTIITANGNPEQTQKGMQSLTAAIIGFVVIFASYWIIQIIQIITGIPILNAPI